MIKKLRNNLTNNNFFIIIKRDYDFWGWVMLYQYIKLKMYMMKKLILLKNRQRGLKWSRCLY